ncbi:MFS transporter [Allosalinactinospora lopnorensis]|uniref:MFS transporter n=1 Tax=Allosalinactinospora lopnorensis TaxID=1352348 RepID=UPI000623EA7D|nr:MFS transporter [Allosalinactinospora lopnorensis]
MAAECTAPPAEGGPPCPSTAAAPTTSTAATAPAGARRAFLLLGTVQVTLIFTLTLVAVPLPLIGREFGVGQSALILIGSAYGLAFSGLLLFGGRLADRYGGQRVFLAGVVVLLTTSILAAAAPGAGTLIGARFAQGAGAALVAPAAMAVLRSVFSTPESHARAMATWGSLSVMGAMGGNLVSGFVATWVSWRWMFAVPLFVTALALALARRLLPRAEPPHGPRPSLDLPGAVLATAGITLFSYALVVIDDHGWSAAEVLIPLLSGLGLLGVFVAVELRARDPLLPPRFLTDARRATALPAILLAAAGTGTAAVLLIFYLQQIRDWSALSTSLTFVPFTIVLIATGAAGSRLVSGFGARVVAVAGLATCAGAFLLLAGLDTATGYLSGLLPGMLLLAAGSAAVFSSAAVLAVVGVPQRQSGLAGGVMNTAMEIGPTAGLAILVAVAAVRTAHLAQSGASAPVATAAGYGWAFGAAGLAFLLLAVVTAGLGHACRDRGH